MKEKLNIAVLTQYYPPEIGAPQARMAEHAEQWVKDGHSVTAITCMPNHPTGTIPKEYQDLTYKEETMNGVLVVRCQTYATPNKGFFKRTLNHIVFMCMSVIQGRKHIKGKDVIVATSPTFFTVISAYVLSKMYDVPFVFEVRDLWPGIFKDLGIIKNERVLSLLEKMELFLYRKARFIVTVTDSFVDHIHSRGIPKEKIVTITNGVNLNEYFPREKSHALIEKLNLNNKFVVLYIGTHGISQGLSSLVDAAKLCQDEPNIHFLFVGEGADKDNVRNKAKALELTNVTFLPGQPKENVVEFYSIMDVSFVPLRDIELFKSFIPSKIFEMLAMNKPMIGALAGESARILNESHSAVVCTPENSQEIAAAVKTLCNDKSLYSKLEEKGYLFVKEHYSREHLAKKYIEEIRKWI